MEQPRKPPVPPKLLKRKEVIIHDVIDLDEDESSADTMICNMKIDARNKGKAIKNISNGHMNHQVITHDVIDLDEDESSAYTMICNMKIDARNKGKAIKNISNGHMNHQAKDSNLSNNFGPSGVATFALNGLESFYSKFCDGKSFAPGSNYSTNLGGHSSDSYHDADKYSESDIQYIIDTVDIPSGVEAPFPWLPHLAEPKSNIISHKQKQSNWRCPLYGIDPYPSIWSSGFAPSDMKPTPVDYVSKPPNSIKRADDSNPSLTAWADQCAEISSKTWQFFQPSFNPNSSSSSLNQAHVKKLPPLPPSLQKKDFPWFEGFNKLTSFPSPLYDPFIDLPIPPGEAKNIWGQEYAGSQNKISGSGGALADLDSNSLSGKYRNLEDVLVKFRSFKQFGTVDDHSDHHYVQKGCSVKQPSKVWAKSIQEEWKILEKDLPDTISVRVYESRMDILRAVIKGADGTPYHDGLFFFDVFFPSDYPNIPPHVHYHAGGLRLNPNLYACGKVCLSLLNTWFGNNNENWIPGKSSMLQVLVSIQGLILNSKPYFNEPGYDMMSATLEGNNRSLKYNEDTFLLSLRTMYFTMRRPPKHFEDMVVGHFCERAHDILVACKAYMDGAQVGCLIKGGIQDVDEGDKSCSDAFRENVAKYLEVLVMWFKNIGAKDCEKFLPPAKIRSERAGVRAATSVMQ